MENVSMKANVEALNFDTKISTVKHETIEVTIDPTILLNDYARAYARELRRHNSKRFTDEFLTWYTNDEGEEVQHTMDDAVLELQQYFVGLLDLRIQSVNGDCPDWRYSKQLWIPSIIQFVLTCVGVVWDVEKGLRFVPKCDSSHNIREMLDTSMKIASFKADGLAMVKDALPRSEEGDFDVMQCAIINDYVMATHRIGHPSSSYIAALLGLQLEKSVMSSLLYRVRYDDVDYIKDMLLREKSLW